MNIPAAAAAAHDNMRFKCGSVFSLREKEREGERERKRESVAAAAFTTFPPFSLLPPREPDVVTRAKCDRFPLLSSSFSAHEVWREGPESSQAEGAFYNEAQGG